LVGWGRPSGRLGRIELGLDGKLIRIEEGPEASSPNDSPASALDFEHVIAGGPVAMGQTRDRRLWETLDHGVHWGSVPPLIGPVDSGARIGTLDELAAKSIRTSSCSLVGCALGDWIRVGWSTQLDPPAHK